jgi:hypothetical protein
MPVRPRTKRRRATVAIPALLLLPALVFAKPIPRGPTSPCAAWLNKTVERMKKLPERRWRDAIIIALGDRTCDMVPEPLSNASRAVRGSRDAAQSDRVLADAAIRVLGPGCAVPDPTEDARALAKTCPLPKLEEFDLAESVFRDIRAVDYALIDALATSLLAAKAYDATAQRLMLKFLLSATLLGEHQNKAVGGAAR